MPDVTSIAAVVGDQYGASSVKLSKASNKGLKPQNLPAIVSLYRPIIIMSSNALTLTDSDSDHETKIWPNIVGFSD